MQEEQKEVKVTIPYTPRYPQTEIHPQLEAHRFCVLVTHRQMSKTVCAINHLIKMALTNRKPYGRYFYVAPFLKQAKLIAWDYLRRYTAPYLNVNIGTENEPHHICALRVNEQETSVTLPNGSFIRICGADNEDALRGTYADGVVLDEYGDIKPQVYDEIIRPMLVSRHGWCVFLGTPKGQNQFFDVYRYGVEEHGKDPDGEWWAGMYRADQTGVIDPEELAKIKERTPDNTYRQEYLCDFAAAAEDALFPQSVIDMAAKNDLPYTGGERVAALDIARYGADSSVLKIWEYAGPLKWKEVATEEWNGKDTMYTVGRVAEAGRSFRFNRLIVDGDGVGGGVIDRLKEVAKFTVYEFRGGAAASDPDRYANKRAEAYDALRELMAKGYLQISDRATLTELATVTYSFNSSGQMKLFNKEELRKKGGKSPDHADAAMMSTVLFKKAKQVHFRAQNADKLTATSDFIF